MINKFIITCLLVGASYFGLAYTPTVLTANDISLSEYSFISGISVSATATYTNDFELTNSGAIVEFYFSRDANFSTDDVLLRTSTNYSSMAPGQQSNTGGRIVIPGYVNPGNYYIVARILNRSENFLLGTPSTTATQFTILPKPDLTVDVDCYNQTRGRGSRVYPGDVVAFSVVTSNIGPADCDGVVQVVKIYNRLGELSFMRSNQIPVKSGESHTSEEWTLTITKPYFTPGWYRIYVDIDPDNQIPEVDEGNNSDRCTFRVDWPEDDVTPPIPTPTPTPDLDLKFSSSPVIVDNFGNTPSKFIVDEYYVINFTIKNEGASDALGFNIHSEWVDPKGIYISAEQYNNEISLGPNEEYEVSTQFYWGSSIQEGKGDVVFKIDKDNRIKESNEGNNSVTVSIDVTKDGSGRFTLKRNSPPVNPLFIWPTKTSDILNIIYQGDEDLDILVYSISGQLKLQKSFETENGDNAFELDVSMLKPDMYILEVIDSKGKSIQRFVKQ